MRRTCRPAPRRVETQRARRGPGGGVRPEARPELEFDPEAKFVSQWVLDHGQSFDWIMLGDPRCMICLGAGRA